MLNREERTAADGEETKEAFCPSSLLLLHLHAPPLILSLSLSLSVSPVLPPSRPFTFSLLLCLCTHYILPLPHSISFPQFIILSHFPRLSVSPPFTSSSSSSLPPPAFSSSVLSFQVLSEHSVAIGSVTVSLETDRVGLPGVSTQQKSKTAVASVKSAPI